MPPVMTRLRMEAPIGSLLSAGELAGQTCVRRMAENVVVLRNHIRGRYEIEARGAPDPAQEMSDSFADS